jgi:uncharacterized membrane protein YeaQ/YmgE (transglycosylase-associated protein family)
MIGSIILGLIAGWITGLVMYGSGFGVIADIVIGLIGAVIGHWVFDLIGASPEGRIGHLVSAVVGAIILVALVHALRGGS